MLGPTAPVTVRQRRRARIGPGTALPGSRSQRVAVEVVAAVFALSAAAVILAPALLLTWTGGRRGLGFSDAPSNILLVSGCIAVTYAVVAHHRLRSRKTRAAVGLNNWLAALNGLVVLALLTTLLLVVVLHQLGPVRGRLGEAQVALLALWAAVHLVAIAAAEVIERGVFRWLRPSPAADRPKRAATQR